MAGYRQIWTEIWTDEWVSELNTEEKLLFIYLFSNPKSTLVGLYKISLKVMSFESGLPVSTVENILHKFELSRKVVYRDGIVWIVNMRKYHPYTSSKVMVRMKADLDKIPDCRIKSACIYHKETGIYNMDDTIPIGYGYDIDTISLIKEKEKVKVKEKEIIKDDGGVFKYFEENIGILTPIIAEELGDAIDEYGAEQVKDAIKIASISNARHMNYIKKVLENKKNGKGKPSKSNIPEDTPSNRHKYAEWEQ